MKKLRLKIFILIVLLALISSAFFGCKMSSRSIRFHKKPRREQWAEDAVFIGMDSTVGLENTDGLSFE